MQLMKAGSNPVNTIIVIYMPKRNKTGPPSGAKGPRDGHGGGKGTARGKGVGKSKGGGKGGC